MELKNLRPIVLKILIKILLVAIPVQCWYFCLVILKIIPETSAGNMIFNGLVVLAMFSATAWVIKKLWLPFVGDLATFLLGGVILWLTLFALGVMVVPSIWLHLVAWPFWLGGIFIRNVNSRWRPPPKRRGLIFSSLK